MYTRFYDNTIETKFIKALIATTYVPLVNTWTSGNFVIKGLSYISKNYILKCNATGFPSNIDDTAEAAKVRYFTKISTYVPTQSYFNLNTRYISNISSYDSTTHYYLGQYLRYIRDIEGIDLMPFYNCFADEYVSNLDFDQLGNLSTKIDEGYKILSVPIKFGKTYSVALSCNTPISMRVVLYGTKGLLSNQTTILDNIIGDSKFIRLQNSSFTSPFKYTSPSWEQFSTEPSEFINPEKDDTTLGQYERCLKLLIKVPKNNKSSVVVLEGDYSTTYGESVGYNAVFTEEGGSSVKGDELNSKNVSVTNSTTTVNSKLVTGYYPLSEIVKGNADTEKSDQVADVSRCLSPLGLLQLSDGNIYAFSNRLIEYLLLNVISPLDEIGKNTERIQKYAASVTNSSMNIYPPFKVSYTPGVWSDRLRLYLFNLMKDTRSLSGNPRVDINGYVDKDTEQKITRGQKL